MRPYRQTSLSGVPYQKLGKRYYDPYQVTEVIGAVAYRLALPDSAKIHQVFHCSLLKPHHGPLHTPPPLPTQIFDGCPVIKPLSILDSKLDTSTNPPKTMVLVQWEGLQPEDTTWEDWTDLKTTYHLEGKVSLQGIGNDSMQGPINNMQGPSVSNLISKDAPTSSRPKRSTRRPQGWDEFIH